MLENIHPSSQTPVSKQYAELQPVNHETREALSASTSPEVDELALMQHEVYEQTDYHKTPDYDCSYLDQSMQDSFKNKENDGHVFLSPLSSSMMSKRRKSHPNEQNGSTETATMQRLARKRKSLNTEEEPPSKFEPRSEFMRCELCSKEIACKNLKRHALFHSKVFRFSCSKCDYKSHMRQNVTTHVKNSHSSKGVEVLENKSRELAVEIARIYDDCFPTIKKRTKDDSMYRGSIELSESFLNNSTASSASSTFGENDKSFTENTIKSTISFRITKNLDSKDCKECQMCNKFVQANKSKCMKHAITHSARHRYKCSVCYVGHHDPYNLKSHIMTQHGGKAKTLDQITPTIETLYETLYKQCFPGHKLPNKAANKSKQMDTSMTDE